MKSAAVGTLAFSVGGAEVFLTPRQARAQGVALKVLKPDEASALDAVCETLVPGAREAGIVNFIDQQCSVPPHEALLSIRIANARPPFVNYYRAVATEIDRQSRAKFGKSFAELDPGQQHDFVNTLRQGKHDDWKGPPQGRIFSDLRTDAVDVVYGTVEGFERLGVPYMPHVLPKTRW